jgi:hypothetical protein
MAIVRCEAHGLQKRSRRYVSFVKPAGYPDTALVCGVLGCEAAGLLWLEEHEWSFYQHVLRIFESATQTVKFRAQ